MTSAMTQTTIPLLEIYNREDPTGKLYPMVEMLARTDQLLLYSDWTFGSYREISNRRFIFWQSILE